MLKLDSISIFRQPILYLKVFMKKLLLLSFFSLTIFQSIGQVTTTVNPTIAQLQQKLSGNGITITGLTITCPTDAYALYSGGTGDLATLPSGILLTTGTATDVAGPNTNDLDQDNGAAGSALGNTLAGSTPPFGGTYDACYLKFIITPSCNTLSINYVFASEEYPEYSVGSINDVFGFVIDGPNPSGGNYTQKNIATLPGTTTPVSIQNVNNGTMNTGPCVNCAYYNGNPTGMAYDGCTTVLTASTAVTPCSQYTMTIGVWDDSDGIIDSGVFLDVNGLSCVGSPTLTTAASPSVICSAQTVTLTAGGGIAGGTYTWTAPAGGGLVTNTGQTVTANPTVTTTYTLSYSDINTCPGIPLTEVVTVTVSPLPAFTAVQSPTGSICPGQSVTLTANGGAGTYSWTPGTSLSTTTNSVTVASPTITTTYTVTRSVGSCSSFTTITVNVSSTSTIAITPATSTICAGQSMTLSTTGTAPFVWTASSGTNPPSTATVVVTPTTTTTYTVLAGPGTCTAQATATVSVIPAFTISVTPPSVFLCNGSTSTLTASGATNYTWTPFYGLNAYTGANVVANPTVTTTYTITGVNGTCTNSTTATVSVAIVNTSVTASSPNYCSGSTPVTLTGSGATTYSWAPGSSLTSTSGTTVGATPSVTTIYTVTGSTGTCSSSNTISINGFVSPTITITPPGTVICNGSSSALTASGATNYSWTPLYGLNAYTGANVVANPTITTTYTIVGVNGVCTNSTTATVTVTTLNTTVTASSPNYCTGGTPVTLTAGSGAASYSWAPATGLSSTSGTTVSATPSVATIYTVTGTTGACSSTKTISVNGASTPTITITPPGTVICSGSSSALTASGATNYSWTPLSGLSAYTGPNVTANPTVTTTYTIVGVNGICTNTTTATVSVTVINPTVTASSTNYCIGGSPVTLTGTGATTYSWAPGSSLSTTTGSVVSATPSVTTTYTLTGTNGTCNNTTTISITVVPNPTITITSPSTVICLGAAGTTLTASGANTYTWSPGSTNGTTLNANPLTTTTYTAFGQTAAGCAAVPGIITVSVTSTPVPTLTASSSTVCLTNTVSITANPNSGYTYSWLPASEIQGVANTSSIIAKPTSSATVIYTLTLSNGVCVASNTISLAVSLCTPPTANFSTLTNDSICTKGCVSFTNTTTGALPINYQWVFPGGTPPTSTLANPEVCYFAPGNYTVALIATNIYGSDTIIKNNYINVADTPDVRALFDTTIRIGQTVAISASGAVSYLWFPNNGTLGCNTCASTIASPTVTTQYIVTGYNSPYCRSRDTITVIVDATCGDFFVPNAFSPNNDGLNETINVHGYCISIFNLQIFNRWGEKVFETSSKENSWDGTYKGKPLDTGVFVYRADGISIDGKAFSMKGNITLIR